MKKIIKLEEKLDMPLAEGGYLKTPFKIGDEDILPEEISPLIKILKNE